MWRRKLATKVLDRALDSGLKVMTYHGVAALANALNADGATHEGKRRISAPNGVGERASRFDSAKHGEERDNSDGKSEEHVAKRI